MIREKLNSSLIGSFFLYIFFVLESFKNFVLTVKIIFSSANATPEFEGRGGEQLGALISNCLARAYESSQAIDLKQLCIFPEKHCWKIYVDILVSINHYFYID